MEKNYEDIIDMNRPVSKRYEPMPRDMRAVQFAPFAALTGLDDALDDTAGVHMDAVTAEIIREEYLGDP